MEHVFCEKGARKRQRHYTFLSIAFVVVVVAAIVVGGGGSDWGLSVLKPLTLSYKLASNPTNYSFSLYSLNLSVLFNSDDNAHIQ